MQNEQAPEKNKVPVDHPEHNPAESSEIEMPQPGNEIDPDDAVHKMKDLMPKEEDEIDPDETIHKNPPPPPPVSGEKDPDDLVHGK
jgi:hypothetical protein